MKITRRRFLFGSVVVAVGGGGIFVRYLRWLDGRSELLVRTLCHHFIPGHDDVPGAVALGVDRKIFDELRQVKRDRLRLLVLVRALERVDFLESSTVRQKAVIQGQLVLAAQDGAPLHAEMLERIYRTCAHLYFTDQQAWPAIRYRTPQPYGYPDYTQCVAT